MRRLLLALTVLALIVPATAQMRGGGMRAGGGFRAGGFHGGGGFRGGVAAGGPVRFSGRGPIIRTVPQGRFFFPGRARFHGFRHNRFNCFNGFCPGFNNFNCFNGFCNGFGFNSGFGFNGFGFGGGWGLPWYIGDYDPGWTGAAYAEHALRYQDDSRDRQLDELMYEMRDQQRELDYLINSMQRGQPQQEAPPQQQEQPQAAPPRGNQRQPSRPYSANAAPTPERQQPATTLVFKDGHRMDVQNYVIAKNTLTVIDGGKRQHIPLAQLDLAATQKVNEDKGVSFKAPTVSVSLLCNPADPNLSCKPHQAGTEAQRSLTP